jgi:hypothetical protein
MAEATTLGPYDKVIALSQGMLNEGLKKMFSIYPTLRRFVYIDAAFVTLKMDLLAPQILIQSNSQTFFQLRYEVALSWFCRLSRSKLTQILGCVTVSNMALLRAHYCHRLSTWKGGRYHTLLTHPSCWIIAKRRRS